MKVVQVEEYGAPVRVVERPSAEPGPGQVRVRVAAATVNPVDWLVAQGVLSAMTPHLALPLALGWDVAGEVAAAGAGAPFREGERVAGLSPWFDAGVGTFAEEVVLDAGLLVAVPDGVDLAEAATVPLNALTARQALGLLGDDALRAGQHLLVTGASGGVGGFAVQQAAATGAEVTALASRGDEDRVRSLGASRVLLRGDDALAAVRRAVPGGFDAVLDAVPVGPHLVAAVRDGGAFVTVLDPAVPPGERGVRVAKVSVVPDRDQLAASVAALAAGTLATRVAERVPLADAAKALDLASAGGMPGKVVLVP